MDKQHILEEIRRTAVANNGVALGVNRFSQETGIKKYDWYGKYWVRWGDAVREAGLTPSQWKIAYEEEVLIKKFIALMRELGHFPLAGELKMKAHQDKDFPSNTTFARFGSKQRTAKRIAEYCKQHEGYDDVFAMCKPVLEQPQVSEEEAVKPDDMVIGYVYLIKVGRHYKIGMSNSMVELH